ncbi:putative tyrosinase protein [Botrytis fragariae]|uniref:tyrosinase n=1 Tax=Botrytis fragariae TaxID=1964551 RepID=A0A8H6AQE7_9HELO|nr:putative tyrosinase protein [Botrytis fragariae]KAF5871460.1 putative tyrosinase protein [Botrytis fragariae]
MGTNTANEDLAQDPTTLRFLNAAILGKSQPDVVNEDTGTEGLMISPDSSLENSHGVVHVPIGDPYGHMSQLSHSAIDLMLWLHHANVDRHFIIWQAIYLNVWMLPEPDFICTVTIAPGDSDTSVSPLTPFYQPNREAPWTSDAARYTNTFGYSYALVPGAIITNATQLSANVTASVNAFHGPEGVFSGSKRRMDENRECFLLCVGPPVAGGEIPPGLTYHNLFASVDAVKAVDTFNIND